MKSRPLALMAEQVFSISSMTRSYMSALRTCLPIGTLSPSRPKYPVNGFSQITCFPVATTSTIMAACKAGGVQHIDDVEFFIAQELAEIPVGRGYPVLARKFA